MACDVVRISRNVSTARTLQPDRRTFRRAEHTLFAVSKQRVDAAGALEPWGGEPVGSFVERSSRLDQERRAVSSSALRQRVWR